MERGRWRRDEGFWGVKEKGRENREMGRGDLEEGLAVKEIGEDDVAAAMVRGEREKWKEMINEFVNVNCFYETRLVEGFVCLRNCPWSLIFVCLVSINFG